MGLASFNRMRLRRVEAMRPEKIDERKKQEEAAKAPKGEPMATEEIVQAEIEAQAEKENEVKTEVKRGSKRK